MKFQHVILATLNFKVCDSSFTTAAADTDSQVHEINCINMDGLSLATYGLMAHG